MTPAQLRDRRRKREEDLRYARQLDDLLKNRQQQYVFVSQAGEAQRRSDEISAQVKQAINWITTNTRLL